MNNKNASCTEIIMQESNKKYKGEEKILIILIELLLILVFLFYITYVYIYVTFIWNLRRRQWHPTPVLLPGKSHGWRGLVGCSPWGREESDMTERLYFHFSLPCIGEGNGNPLQCSCLESPRDGGACGLPSMGSQSRTQLKRLSIWNLICVSISC